MEKILFKTTDTLYTRKDRKIFENYFVTQAQKSGLTILEHDIDHLTMVGYKWNFLKYYIMSTYVSVKHGQKLSMELKRIISVLFWK